MRRLLVLVATTGALTAFGAGSAPQDLGPVSDTFSARISPDARGGFQLAWTITR